MSSFEQFRLVKSGLTNWSNHIQHVSPTWSLRSTFANNGLLCLNIAKHYSESSTRCCSHFEQSFLMDKCSCNIKPTRSFEILTMSAISRNFTSRSFGTILLFFYVFWCLASLVSPRHVWSQQTNVLLWFLMVRNPHNTFQAIASLGRYFFYQETL